MESDEEFQYEEVPVDEDFVTGGKCLFYVFLIFNSLPYSLTYSCFAVVFHVGNCLLNSLKIKDVNHLNFTCLSWREEKFCSKIILLHSV